MLPRGPGSGWFILGAGILDPATPRCQRHRGVGPRPSPPSVTSKLVEGQGVAELSETQLRDLCLPTIRRSRLAGQALRSPRKAATVTSLICWIGVDQRGPASAYLASDSRISWETNPRRRWDTGRKLFASRLEPELLGYVGQVLFPSQALPQIIDLVDAGLLFEKSVSPEAKRTSIFNVIKNQFEDYPVDRGQAFTIIYCTRYGLGMESRFHIYSLRWENSSWHEEAFDTPSQSGVIGAWGSGRRVVEKLQSVWSKAQGERTSRNVFGAFCSALEEKEDRFTGGAPQLVGLYRKGAGQTFGVIFKGLRYLGGVRLLESTAGLVEWRNELFERCDGLTGIRLKGAQPHSHPQGLRRDTSA
jgi:hypothetical protein